MSTPSVSYQTRAMPEATSALFWWSAVTISTGLPSTGPKSSAAMRAATPAAAQENLGVKIGVLSDMNSLYADITGKGTGVAPTASVITANAKFVSLIRSSQIAFV